MTSTHAKDDLGPLFERVVSAARESRPESLSGPIEVSELVDLVPYKAVRGDAGVESNDDYHHALTRLLSGEGGYVFADELMQDDLKAELGSSNPNVSAYRSYLNAKITLSIEKTRSALATLGLPDIPAEAIRTRAPTPRDTLVPQPRRAPSPVAVVEAGKHVARPGCRYCGQALPEGREVRYCPHCGLNVQTRRCAACSAEMESGWKFCVACGRAATG